MRTGERGTVTVWMLALALLVLGVGGIALDLWRVIAERRELAAVADAAALAGASGIDEEWWRATGEVRLDPLEAAGLALAAVAAHPERGELAAPPEVRVDGDRVWVAVSRQVPPTLLVLMSGEREPLDLRVEAVAVAQPVP